MARKLVESATNRYLDDVIERLKLPSDYALAGALGVTTQAIYKMRGGGAMSVTTAAKIAELLELEPIHVIADIELERGEDSALWKRIRDAAVVAAMAIGAASFGLPGPAQAGLNITSIVALPEYTLRANRRRVRTWPAWLAVLFRG